MAKRIIAINASPRTTWNTAQLVRAAAQGAEQAGAEAEVIDLARLEEFGGCRSCFACKSERSRGACAIKDGLAETLEKLRAADGIILGSPNYAGSTTAIFRALFERLTFQYVTYRSDVACYKERPVPVLFIMTSNVDEGRYEAFGYDAMIANHVSVLESLVGPVTTFVAGATLQVDDYERRGWTAFDADERRRRHDEVFPQQLEEVRGIAARLFAIGH